MFPGADLAGVDWVASHVLLEKQNIEKLKKVVNIMAEVKVNSQHRCLTVISTRVHCKVRYNGFENSQGKHGREYNYVKFI